MGDVKVNKENSVEVIDIISNSSLNEFLNDEEKCLNQNDDVDLIISQISMLSSSSNNKFQIGDESRTIEDILKEAEALINQPIGYNKSATTISCESTPSEIKNNILDQYDYSTSSIHDDDTSDRTLLNDQLDTLDSCPSSPDTVSSMKSKKSSKSSGSKKSLRKKVLTKEKEQDAESIRVELNSNVHTIVPEHVNNDNNETYNNYNNSNDDDFGYDEERSPTINEFSEFESFVIENGKILCDKSTAHSPTHSVVSSSSYNSNWARERELENTNENLHEKLKDSEERLQSLRIQYDSLSQVHRVLRDNHMQLQEETDKLKIDFQILTECANVLRCELQTVKKDHESAIEFQKLLQQELDDNRVDKKKFHVITERDSKNIQDLQRQCKEMERILMRKHPDSVSALIVASKSANMPTQDTSASTRRLLEERIAQLESDAKEQDKQAQTILASVQARFKTVQAKYETHIQDLETQVLSLQQINLDYSRELTAAQNYPAPSINESTQTIDVPERESQCRTIGVQTAPGLSNPPSRTSSSTSISGVGSSAKKSNGKIPTSQSDSSIQPKEDAHLLATLRGMRIELAIKEKAVQRLTRDLEDCKKTVKKLQKERDMYLKEKDKQTAATPKKAYNPSHYQENSDSQALKEALNKIKVVEDDFKTLYEKRLKDLKTLQSAHERDLSACHETIRILQSRLEEQSTNVKDKRRGPVDYYSLKAKVTSLEKRHCDREKSLHLLIDALSKGKISGTQHGSHSISPDESSSPHSCNSPVNKNF